MPCESSTSNPLPVSEGGRYLVIVAREQAELWQYLQRDLAAGEGVEVVLDRRLGGRWQWNQTRDLQAQGKDRRRTPNVDADLRNRSFVIVPR